MQYQAAYISGEFSDDSRQDWDDLYPRPISWSCWYPTSIDAATTELRFGGDAESPLFTQGLVAENAQISNAQNEWPLVLLSHGTGGTATGMSWLGTRLAQRGFICIGVDHHGNTAAEPYRAEGFICWWERAADLSLIIDQANQFPTINNRVNLSEISVAGFSLGGYTALALAGAVTSMERFEKWITANPSPMGGPREFPNLDQEISRLMASSPRFRQSWEKHDESYLEPRISKCVAIAPAPPVRAFLTQSVAEIECSTFIVAGEADLEAPFEQCSLWLSKQNPAFRLHSVGKEVGHYVFLAECTEQGKCVDPAICMDHPNVSRSTIHDRVSSMIGDFLATI